MEKPLEVLQKLRPQKPRQRRLKNQGPKGLKKKLKNQYLRTEKKA